ncbi:MAG: restriction endonuclease subunit S [Aeromonas salmonicida]
MGSNKNFVALGSLCSQVLTGGTPLTQNKHFFEGGTIPWLKTKEVNFNFINSTENYITKAGLDGSSAKLVPINSVIIAMYGQGDTAGRVAINKIPLTTNQACCNLVINPNKADYRFIYYYLKSSYSELVRRKTGSAQPNLNTKILKEFEIIDLSLEQQIAIGDQLEAIDNKIHFNRQINQTLEEMAQTLFKSWFVDFDPVIDNALDAGFFEQDLAFPNELLCRAEARRAVRERSDFKPLPDATRQLFPAAFEECVEPSLGLGGWVPKGWKYKTAENIAHVTIGKTPPRKESEWFSERKTNNTTWVSIRDMGVFGSHTGRTNEYLTTEAIEKFNVKKVPKGSILLSFKLTLGRVTIASEELTTNEAIAHFIELKYGINVPYLYCYLINFNYPSLGSTSSIATAVNSKIIKSMPILVPAESILDCFKKQSDPSFKKMKSLDDETAMLTNLRDTILPKLISGELRLDNIAADLAKVKVEVA